MAPIQSDIAALPEGMTNDALKLCMNTDECKMKSKVTNNSEENGSQLAKQPAQEFLFLDPTPSFAENEESHQVTIDVRDFKDGDVKVKVVDDNEVVVEGNIEKERDGSVTKRSFYRRFSLPGRDSKQNVFASISADGVLTITVPKKEASSGEQENTNSNIPFDAEKKNKMEVKVERISKSSEEKEDLEDAQDTKESADESPADSHCLLPTCEMGLFFNDCFFEDIRKEFEAVVDQMIDVFGNESTNENESCDKNLESNNIAEETQSMALSEDQQSFKVVLDVRGYPSEDVRVRVEDEEVVVEGSVEKEEDSFRSTKSFCRRFNFPAEVDLKALTSAVSSDGVLTITTPKPVQSEEEKKEVQS